MTRLLAILLFLILAWVGLQRALARFRLSPLARQLIAIFRALNGAQRRQPGASQGPSSPRAAPAQLVRCRVCSTHIPAERAVRSQSGEAAYCSEECLREAAAS